MSFKVKLVSLLAFFLLLFQVVPALATDSNAATTHDQSMYQNILQQKATPNQATSARPNTVNMEKANSLIGSLKVKDNSTAGYSYEVEPNDKKTQANTLKLDQVMYGTITDDYYDLDYYKLTVTKAGTLLVAGALSSTSDSTANSYFAMGIENAKNTNDYGYSSYYSSNGVYGQYISFDVTPGTYNLVVFQLDTSGYYVGEQYSILASMSSGSTTDNTVKSLSADPTSMDLEVGNTDVVTVTATYTDGSDEDVTESATWKSSNSSVATVDFDGSEEVITAVGNGSATITASYGGKTATISVTVGGGSTTQDQYLEVSPETVNILYGKTQKVNISLVDNGNTTDVTSKCKFESADTETATVKGATIKGVSVGNTTVTATYNDLSVDIEVNVIQPVATLTAEPSSLNLVEDEDAQIDLTATYKGDDQDVSIEPGDATWSTKKKDDIVTVDQYGQVHATKTGTTTITASYGGKSVTIPVNVTLPVEELICLPTEVGVAKGKTQAVTIYAIYEDDPNKLVDVSKNVSLNCDDDVVSVSGTTIKAGKNSDCETTVYGSYGGQDIEIPVVVTEPIKSLVEDNNTTELELDIDQTESLSLTATYKDGSDEDVSQRVVAVSSKPSVATVETSDGEISITGISKGTSTITLSYEGKKVSVKVTVLGNSW